MRAAVLYDRKDLRVEAAVDPGPPGAGKVLLAVSRAAICGTDVSEYFHGPRMVPLHRRHPVTGHQGPTILGHEFVGVVVAVGDGVSGARVGDRVVPGSCWCGACRLCGKGRHSVCPRYFVYGLHAHGGLAEFALVSASACQPVPPQLDATAAACAQPLAVACHAIRRSRLQAGETVAVVGVGGIGAFLVAAAAARKPALLLAVDIDERRLEVASVLGATHTASPRRTDLAALVRGLTDGAGPDVVVEASGSKAGLELAWATVGRGGRVHLVGLHAAPVPLDFHGAVVNEIDVSHADGDLAEALRLLAASELGAVVLDRVIDLEALVPEGLLALAEGRAAGKVIVAVSDT